jgi:hypothetical protein
MEIIGAIKFSPGFLNQTVLSAAKEKLNSKTFKNLLLENLDIK